LGVASRPIYIGLMKVGRWEVRDLLEAKDIRSSNDALLSVYCTRCQLLIVAWREQEEWTQLHVLR
jgi:hypothetical protein